MALASQPRLKMMFSLPSPPAQPCIPKYLGTYITWDAYHARPTARSDINESALVEGGTGALSH